ncbi:MAG TPA: SMC-Scp complex subunit ScpB [Chloroflexota bacterium]|jgi:segregation and condensation protein B|nr:SMC-Scp complex subunit ScpB [Chloroflexota bacterium]
MLDERTATVEALLLVAPDGVAPAELARGADLTEQQVDATLDQLDSHYRAGGHGLRLQRHEGVLKLVTADAASAAVARFLKRDRPARLSGAALDTLAIIAYRQPITRSAIEAIRGVGSEHVVTVLLNLGLIEEVGRAESVGRAVLYGTTAGFLESAGLASLAELPPLPGTQD